MLIEITDIEARLIVQAAQIWLGEFPDSNCKPTILWGDELKTLIKKIEQAGDDGQEASRTGE